MKFFSSLKGQALSFLEGYKTREPATYAAAEQAVGAILITDGLIGIEMPFGQKKRPGIFGTVVGIAIGVVFMFIPSVFGNMSGLNNMTAITTATVVSVGQGSYTSKGGSTCSMSARYIVDGQEYSSMSTISSSGICSLSPGQQVKISYDPVNPVSWAYDTAAPNLVLKIFFWIGLLFVISNIFTFFVRLFSIIFGWKLLKDGRKNAASLPPGTNLQTMIDEIKKNFMSSAFNFGIK